MRGVGLRKDAGAEVLGDIALAMVNAMGAFKAIALEILAERGMAEPKPHHWYPLADLLSGLEQVATRVGPNTVYQIGRQIPDQGYYPPGLDTIAEVLQELDPAYQACHRGGDIGSYQFTFTGMSAGKMVCSTPYPCDFDRGVLESLSRRFERDDVFVHLEHDELTPCRKLGGESCTYRIDW